MAAAFFLTTRWLQPFQLPTSEKLSAEDNREFLAELNRLQRLLKTANDKGVVEFQIAKTYAAGGQYSEAMNWLRTVTDEDLGFDPSRDPDFPKLRNTAEFKALIEKVRLQTPRVSNSHLVASIQEATLFPENMAFEPKTSSFLFGNTAKAEVVRCTADSGCVLFASLSGKNEEYVLGLKTDMRSGSLWTTDDAPDHAALREYELHSGKQLRSALLEGKHVFNDIVISSAGSVYVTDTSEGAVYNLASENNSLRKIAPGHTFTAANGIALSPDERTLYVSAWGDGIDAVDLKSERITPVPHPATICLAYIDGLYAANRSLLAIQNGPMVPRIVQFTFNPEGREIVGMTVLERRNPLFDGITTGALVNGKLYYVANPQMDRKGVSARDPLKILLLPILP